MCEALEVIDAELGLGAARNNPPLIAAYVQACASIHSAKVIQEGWDEKVGTKR